jgi:hypothetical protein
MLNTQNSNAKAHIDIEKPRRVDLIGIQKVCENGWPRPETAETVRDTARNCILSPLLLKLVFGARLGRDYNVSFLEVTVCDAA